MQAVSMKFRRDGNTGNRSVMRRTAFHALMLAVLFCMFLPGVASAQGFVRPLGPWDFMARMGLSAYSGYFGHRDGVNLSFFAADQPSGSVQRLNQQYRLEGISTEILLPIRTAGPVGFVCGGGYSGCFRTDAEETLQKVGTDPLKRNWRVQPQACNVHAAVTIDVLPSVLGLIGFRYENFQTKFLSPNGGFSAASTNDSANLAYNAYLPCVGFVLGTPACVPGLHVQLGLVGCPLLLGSVEYRETWNQQQNVGNVPVNGFVGSNPISKGAFIDAFGEVSFVTCGGIEMGAYAKYEYMTGSTNVYVGQGNNALPTVVYDFDFQKRLWGIGGRVSIGF